MCGGSNKAANEANRQEQARQARIARNVSAVDAAFGSSTRAAEIADFLAATRQNYQLDLDRQRGEANRQTRFALARNGTSGGSADVDSNRLLSEQYQEGVIEADRRAQAAAAGIQSADEAARQNLVALATSGANVSNAAQRAASAFSTNIANARQDATQSGLNDLFSQFANIYKTSNETAERRRAARDYGTLYGNPYASTFSGGYR